MQHEKAHLRALLGPMIVTCQASKPDGAVMLAVAVVFSAAAFVMPPGRIAGALFVVALIAHVYLAFRQERAAAPAGHGAV